MIITLTGENTFAIAEAERQLCDAFTQKYHVQAEYFEAESLTPPDLPDILQGATIFSPVRFVLLRGVAAHKLLHEPLHNILQKVTPDTTVVISDPALDKRTKFYKFLKAHSTFKDFLLPREAEVQAWLQKTAKALGGTLQPDEARYLVERAGPDQWRLRQEITKLVTFQPVVTRAAIDALVEPGVEGTAFDLLDAALSGSHQRITSLLRSLRGTEDPYRFFGLLASQIHAFAVVSAAQGRSADAIAKEAGLHPFVVRKVQGSVRFMEPAHVARMAYVAALTDMQLKSSGANPWDIIAVCLQRLRPENT